MLPPAKWADVVALGVLDTEAELQRLARAGTFGPLPEVNPFVLKVPLGEIKLVVSSRWETVEAQAGQLNAMRYYNPTAEVLAQRRLEGLYPQQRVPAKLQRSRRLTKCAAEFDISGVSSGERSRGLERCHRHEVRMQIFESTVQYLSTPANSKLHLLFRRLLKTYQQELAVFGRPHRDGQCTALTLLSVQQERAEIARLAVEAAAA